MSKRNNTSFELTFEYSPIPSLVIDFTELYMFFDSLKQNGIQNLNVYFQQNPESILKCIAYCKIIEVNPAVLALYEVNNVEELSENFESFFTENTKYAFKENFVRLFDGESYFATETEILTKTGRIKFILLKSNIHKEKDHILGFCSTEDISETKIQQEQLRKAFMNIPDAVHINRVSDATFVDFNDYFLRYTGYSREELLGKTPDDLNIWVENENSNNYYKRLKEKGFIKDFEITFRMKDGSFLDALISSNIVESKGERQIITVTRDISKFKTAQEELKRSEEKFQSVFKNSPDAMAILEMDRWTYVDVNDMFLKITGTSRQEVLGKSTSKLNLWYDVSERDYFLKMAENREEFVNHERLFTKEDGRQIHMLVSSKLIEINQQKQYLLIAKDIDDFVKIKSDLYEKDNLYKTIVSNSYEGIAIINDNYQFRYTNYQFESIVGYSKQELIGLDFRMILTPESAVFVGKQYKDRQAGKKAPQHYTFEVLRKNGEIRTIEIHSSAIQTAEGKMQTIAQILDVTDREKAAKIIATEHQRAKQYFEVAGMIMIAVDKTGIVTAVNKKGCEILETSEENIVGKNWFSEFVPKNISQQLQNNYICTINLEVDHKPYNENLIITSSGKEKLIGWRNSLIKDENDNVIGMLSSGEDISNKEDVGRILNLSGMVAILWKNAENLPIEFVSDNAKNLLGYNPNDFYSGNINYHQLLHPEDIDRVKQEVKKYSAEKRTNYTHQPYRIITKNGEVKWISDRTTVQYNSEGKIAYYYGILSDITDDILKGEKLRQSNEILSQMNDAVISVNFSGEITSWVGGAESIFGYKANEAVGENIQLIWGPKTDTKRLLTEILDDINSSGVYQSEVFCLGKDKPNIPIELTAKILYDSMGIPLSLILVNRDITNRKVAQKALEDSEKRYRHIFESILDGVIIYNMDKEIVQVNKMATLMYGYSSNEFTQTAASRFIHPVQNHSFKDVLNHLGTDYTKMFEGESVDHTKSGDRFFVNAKGRLIDYNNEQHLLIIVRDITKIKQAEHDLFKAKEKAIESEQLKSSFLANMSHEIRTPMNSIIGFSELLGDDDISTEEKHHFLRIIRQNGNQLLTIINDIIDVSKIEAGQIKLNYEETDIYETFQDIYNMFELTTKDKGLELIKKSIDEEEEFLIQTDELRLKQILINLISNALKFTHNGFIEFGCNIIDQEKSIHFYVKDTGIGISKDKQGEIFQRFMQAELKTTKLYGGTGLGLAISKGLVQTFKGKLWLDSEEGMGSTFNFSIPLILK